MIDVSSSQYKIDDCAVFRKTKEQYGALSNMCAGFPLIVNDIRIKTSEALYQALRFPHLPDVQKAIIAENSPMSAKFIAKKYYPESRIDWTKIKIDVMRYCLHLKLFQNQDIFTGVLQSTGDKQIVEYSTKDDFWGAKEFDANQLCGSNILGKLLVELRDDASLICSRNWLEPIALSDFVLYGKQIESIHV